MNAFLLWIPVAVRACLGAISAAAADVEADAAPVLNWFQLTRQTGKTLRYAPHLVDDRSGVGCQVVAADVTGDGRPDILTVSKLGAFVFVNGAAKPTETR